MKLYDFMYDWEAFMKASERITFIICGRIQMGSFLMPFRVCRH